MILDDMPPLSASLEELRHYRQSLDELPSDKFVVQMQKQAVDARIRNRKREEDPAG